MRRLATLLLACVPAACGDPAPPVVLEPRDGGPLEFRNPEQCRECHPDHVADWEGSMHAYAVRDPVFQALNRVKTLDHAGEAADFCTQCHTLPGFLAGETGVTLGEDGVWRQNTEDLSVVAAAGVSCDVCHSITALVTEHNVGYAFAPDGTVRGPFGDGLPTDFHAQIESPLHREGTVCVGCHNVLIPDGSDGFLLERTGAEWEEYRAAGGAEECQDCHMPERTGQAAVDGPVRTVHAHTFVGVDIALVDFPDRARQRALVEALLAGAVDLTLEPILDGLGRPTGVRATLANRAGHAVPSGTTSERQMWLHLAVTDSAGATVYETGFLDAGGDLMDGVPGHSLTPEGDPDLWWFGAHLLSNGSLIDFPHLADGIDERLLPPGGEATRDFLLPALPAGTYTVTAALRFRSFAPYFLRALEEHQIGSLDPAVRAEVPIFPMSSGTLELVL